MLLIASDFSFPSKWKGLTGCVKVCQETCLLLSGPVAGSNPKQVFPVYLLQGGHHLASEYGIPRDSRFETKQLENAEI